MHLQKWSSFSLENYSALKMEKDHRPLEKIFSPSKKPIEFSIWGIGYQNPLSQFFNSLGSFIDQVQTSYSDFRQPWNNLTYLVLK